MEKKLPGGEESKNKPTRLANMMPKKSGTKGRKKKSDSWAEKD